MCLDASAELRDNSREVTCESGPAKADDTCGKMDSMPLEKEGQDTRKETCRGVSGSNAAPVGEITRLLTKK
jgi:hypothetical protein